MFIPSHFRPSTARHLSSQVEAFAKKVSSWQWSNLIWTELNFETGSLSPSPCPIKINQDGSVAEALNVLPNQMKWTQWQVKPQKGVKNVAGIEKEIKYLQPFLGSS